MYHLHKWGGGREQHTAPYLPGLIISRLFMAPVFSLLAEDIAVDLLWDCFSFMMKKCIFVHVQVKLG